MPHIVPADEANPRGGKTPGYATPRDHRPEESVPLSVAGKKLGALPVSKLLP